MDFDRVLLVICNFYRFLQVMQPYSCFAFGSACSILGKRIQIKAKECCQYTTKEKKNFLVKPITWNFEIWCMAARIFVAHKLWGFFNYLKFKSKWKNATSIPQKKKKAQPIIQNLRIWRAAAGIFEEVFLLLSGFLVYGSVTLPFPNAFLAKTAQKGSKSVPYG